MDSPQLIVFDLDFTLWDCGGTWCDCLSPPFRRRRGKVVDSGGHVVRLYDDVVGILDECEQSPIPVALASRTEQPVWARELVGLLGITHRFSHSEIYPSSKLKHFAALQSATEIDFEHMLFFDDERRNITEVSTLGVTCIHVNDGMTAAVFQRGLAQHQNRRS